MLVSLEYFLTRYRLCRQSQSDGSPRIPLSLPRIFAKLLLPESMILKLEPIKTRASIWGDGAWPFFVKKSATFEEDGSEEDFDFDDDEDLKLGGLQLDQDMRALVSHFSGMTQRTVRDKFSRSTQMAMNLNIEKGSEILQVIEQLMEQSGTDLKMAKLLSFKLYVSRFWDLLL
nr:conserved oligomeric Golgi complex subunit 4-like [Tanacetum cinerariifolium]